jgi:hypothetical protein
MKPMNQKIEAAFQSLTPLTPDLAPDCKLSALATCLNARNPPYQPSPWSSLGLTRYGM